MKNIVSRKLVTLGSINVDDTFWLDRLPVVGETVQAGNCTRAPGGKGLNQTVAAARLGMTVGLLSAVGADEAGEDVLALLRAEGVGVDFVRVDCERKTGLAAILIDPRGENLVVTYAGANGAVDEMWLASVADRVFTGAQLSSLHWDLPRSVGEAFIRYAYERGVPVVLNLAPFGAIRAEALRKVDTLIVNESEAAALCKKPCDSVAAAKERCIELRGQVGGGAIITLGESGAVAARGSELRFFKACNVKAIDTTAAGDTFVAAFCAFYDRGFFEAVSRANVAASIAVSRPGALPSLPRLSELRSKLKDAPGRLSID